MGARYNAIAGQSIGFIILVQLNYVLGPRVGILPRI